MDVEFKRVIKSCEYSSCLKNKGKVNQREKRETYTFQVKWQRKRLNCFDPIPNIVLFKDNQELNSCLGILNVLLLEKSLVFGLLIKFAV